MTRVTLIQKIIKRCPDLDPQTVESMINLFFDDIMRALAQDKTVVLRGFGKFRSKTKSAYIGRNPKTGQTLKVASKKLISFKGSNVVLRDLNQGHQP